MEWTVACSCLSKHVLSDYTDSLLTNIAWSFMYYVVCTVQGERESHEFHTGRYAVLIRLTCAGGA